MIKRLSFYFTFGSVLLSSLLAVFSEKDFFLSLINSSFLLSLVLLMVGAIFFLLQGGMFNGIIFGFNRFMKKMNKTEQYAAEIYEEDQDKLLEPYHFSFIPAFFISGSILFVLSMIASFTF
jgi:hypothetical protein